jgi:succinoglycan biosynthesis protein ExoA
MTGVRPESDHAYELRETVAVIMVLHDEPLPRVQRALDALSAQRGVDPFDVLIAAPWRQAAKLLSVETHGAVRALIFVENPSGARSAGLNVARRAARSDIVVRVDARSVVRFDHVARCVDRLRDDARVGVVGGVQYPEAYSPSLRVRGIARGLRNRWMLGNASYRRAHAAGPVDTVYLGAFRRDELARIGGYDERLDANEDFELCARYRSDGKVVWLEQELVVGYEPRSSLTALGQQYYAFGASKVRFWRATGGRPNARQRVALVAGGTVAVVAVVSLRAPRMFGALALGAVAGIAAADHLADPAERDPRVRAHAWVANVVVLGGWLAGVATELPPLVRRSGDVEHALERDAGPLGGTGVDGDLVDHLAAHE